MKFPLKSITILLLLFVTSALCVSAVWSQLATQKLFPPHPTGFFSESNLVSSACRAPSPVLYAVFDISSSVRSHLRIISPAPGATAPTTPSFHNRAKEDGPKDHSRFGKLLFERRVEIHNAPGISSRRTKPLATVKTPRWDRDQRMKTKPPAFVALPTTEPRNLKIKNAGPQNPEPSRILHRAAQPTRTWREGPAIC